jgi:hypothetical protein
MTYSFHNRFTTFNERLNIDALSRVLADTGTERVRLSAGAQDTMIKDTGDLVLDGSGYDDGSTARAAGRRWRRDLTVAFARSHIGVDFGPDNQVAPRYEGTVGDDPPEHLTLLGLKPGDRIIRDQHRLLVVKSEPRPRFLRVWGEGVVRRELEQFEEHLTNARVQADKDWTAEKTLAHRLVSNALRDDNPETQHIQLVTAIELLLKEQDRPPAVLDALNDLIDEFEQRPAEDDTVRTRLLEILHGTREESISRAACDQLSALLAGEYLDKPVTAFFSQVYNMRSRLLHRQRRKTETRPTTVELGEVHFELLRLVLDFLAASE